MIVTMPSIPQPSNILTHVELVWRAKQTEQRLRFGRPVTIERCDRERRRACFAPGAIFALLHWSGNSYGTTSSRIDILRAVGHGETYTTVPQVAPGAVILLSISTWPKVERVLQAIDVVEALNIDPVHVAPDYWQHVHNRISVGDTPGRYTVTRHKAWLKRRRIVP